MSSDRTLQIGGTLGERAVYIERRDDQIAYECLKANQYCNILTTRQMGKSSLMMRLRRRLKEDGVRTVSIDIAGDIGSVATADDFYIGLLDQIAIGLDLDVDVGQWWHGEKDKTANQKLVGFLRTVLVEQVEGPIVVFLDEIDATLKLNFSDDLFTGIRTVFNGRSEFPKTSELSFCLLGTATPTELIKERRTTPYNVGATIELQDFDPRRDNLSPLEAQLSATGRDGKLALAEILEWTSGHPFLTTTMCRRVMDAPRSQDIASIVQSAIGAVPAEALKVHFSWINNFLATRLQHGSETFGLYASVLANKKKVKHQQTDAQAELRLSGLVKTGDDGYLVVRNQIYLQRFGAEWLARARPPRFPKWVVPASGASLLFVLGLILVLAWQRRQATQARAEILSRVAAAVTVLPTLRDADELDAKRAETGGLVSSLEPAERVARRQQVEEAYQKAWDNLAQPYDTLANSLQEIGSSEYLEKACLLTVAAAVKRGAKEPALLAWILQRAPYLSDLRATLRLGDTPIRTRSVTDSIAATITSRQLVIWGIDNQSTPERVELAQRPSALATTPAGLVAVAAGNSVQFWRGTAQTDVGKPRRLQPLGTVTVPCPSVSALALGADVDGFARLATGCEDGKVQILRIDTRAADGKSLKVSEPLVLAHVEEGRPSSIYAAAFGPGPDELTTASLLKWATIWSWKRKPPTYRSLGSDQALDVRTVAPDQLVVSGQPLDDRSSSSPLSVLYRRRGTSFAETARGRALEGTNAQILAGDVSADGNRIAAAISMTEGGEIILWSPDAVQRPWSTIALPKVSPRDVAYVGKSRLVVALDDNTLRVFEVSAAAAASDGGATSDRWREWQARLGWSIDDDGRTAVRPLWRDAQPTGYTSMRGPLKD